MAAENTQDRWESSDSHCVYGGSTERIGDVFLLLRRHYFDRSLSISIGSDLRDIIAWFSECIIPTIRGTSALDVALLGAAFICHRTASPNDGFDSVRLGPSGIVSFYGVDQLAHAFDDSRACDLAVASSAKIFSNTRKSITTSGLESFWLEMPS